MQGEIVTRETDLAEKIGTMSAQITNAAKSMDAASITFVQHLETERLMEVERNKKVDEALKVARAAESTAKTSHKRQDGFVIAMKWLWGAVISLGALAIGFLKSILT